MKSVTNLNSFAHFDWLIVVQDTARRVARVSTEAKLQLDEAEYVEKFKPHLMDVVFSWCNGATFSQILKMTSVFEGESKKAV